MADIFEKIKANRGPIGMHATASHGYFTFPKLEGDIGPHMNFRGKEKLNWSLNNYLGLANHPEVRKTDADAVFGLMYAQCEDDFQRVEMNYITMLGRTSEINGEQNMYEDLLVKMVIDSAASVKDYEASPDWMKKLLNAFADGVNYYLYKNPKVKPALLREFKPWYPLTYTDGSISAIQTSDLTANDIKKFYAGLSSDLASLKKKDPEQLSGSNGFAIAPSRSLSGNVI